MNERATRGADADGEADLLTARQAAAYLGVQVVTIYAAIRRGALAPTRCGRRGRLNPDHGFRRADLDAYRERVDRWYKRLPTLPTPVPMADPPGDLPPINHYDLRMLEKWRRYLGMERLDLARMSGVSYTMIWYAESGRYYVRGRLVNRIAHALGVPATLLASCAPSDERAQAIAASLALRFALRRLEHTKSEVA